MAMMSILAPMTGGARDETVLRNAFAASKPVGAHVRALFVRPDPSQAMPYFGDEMAPAIAQDLVTASNEAADRAAAAARDTLKRVAEDAGANVVDTQIPGNTASFRDVQGDFTGCVMHAARLADLVVLGPLKEGDRPGLTEAFESVLMETGRPVVLSAQAVPAVFASRVAVGWNGSLASAHAVSAALPYLARAKAVEVLTVRSGSSEAPANGDVLEYLQLHGVHASARTIEAQSKGVGRALLDGAVDGGADLLVAGGYGHRRWREFFMGGVTRHVVSQANMPLFLVH